MQILNNDFLADQCPPLDGFQAFTRVGLPNFNLNTSFNNGTSSPTVSSGFFELSLGYVRQCIINASFDYIRMFDTYRYYKHMHRSSGIVAKIIIIPYSG